MADQHRFRTVVELPEYTAQLDEIVAKYPLDVIEPILRSLMWGISTNPTQYDTVLWNHRIAKSRAFRLETPTFRIFFKIEKQGQDDEQIVLCWIEEISAVDEQV